MILLFLVLVATGVAAGLIWENEHKEEGLDGRGNVENIDEEKSENDENISGDDFVEKVVKEKRVVQYEGDDPNVVADLSDVITHAEVNGNNLVIRVSIDQYLDDGTCKLTLSRAGSVLYNNEVNIINDVSTSSCEGFDVPVSQLGNGAIEITIDLSTTDGKSGIIYGEASI